MEQKIAIAWHPGHQVAKGLAVFSLLLGAAEIIWPGAFTRLLGLGGLETLILIYGVREIVAGIGILGMPRHRAHWLWFRVAGDPLDIATVLFALTYPNPPIMNIVIALVLLVGVTLIDIWCARVLTDQLAVAKHSDAYRDRSGLGSARGSQH
jgi:hypothetical protein